MKKQQTTEQLIGEVFLTLLIFITIGLMVNRWVEINLPRDHTPQIEDLHQQQEIADYHWREGRRVIIFR